MNLGINHNANLNARLLNAHLNAQLAHAQLAQARAIAQIRLNARAVRPGPLAKIRTRVKNTFNAILGR